jgi:hypothetical protein
MVEALLLVFVGALLEGTDILRNRLQRWEALASADIQASASRPPIHPLRSTVLGALFEGQASARRGVSSLGRLGLRMLGRGAQRLEPITAFMPIELLLRWDSLLDQGQLLLDRWLLEGHDIEQQGRALARRALDTSYDEILGYLAHEPQIRHLIEQQSVGFADEAVGEVRTRAASADAWLEHVTQALRRRTPRTGKPAEMAELPAANQEHIGR